jgi:hypothetical protein
VEGQQPVVLMEMTLRNLLVERGIDHADFLARADILGALGKTVLISNYARYFRLVAYLTQATHNQIRMVMGVPSLEELFDEKYYTDMDGGILEALGRLFKSNVKLMVYPFRHVATGELVTAEKMKVHSHLRHLYGHLVENEFIEPIQKFDMAKLSIFPRDVLAKIQSGDRTWETMVPAPIVPIIKERRFFGYQPAKA